MCIGLIQNVIAILLGLKVVDYLSFVNVLCCVDTVMNRPNGQTRYKWKQTRDGTSEPWCHCEAWTSASGMLVLPPSGSKAQTFPSMSLHVSVPIISWWLSVAMLHVEQHNSRSLLCRLYPIQSNTTCCKQCEIFMCRLKWHKKDLMVT